jgi:Myristoyl-CoA:protein N-myristoyltransferase, N-terminal domain
MDSDDKPEAKAPTTKSSKKGKKNKQAAAENQPVGAENIVENTDFKQMFEQLKLSSQYFSGAKDDSESPAAQALLQQQQLLQQQSSFKFWSTQPVPKMDEKIEANEPIEEDKDVKDIRAEPYSLPDGFKWDTLNLNEPLILDELYFLLNENYVEDSDAMFRFDYQRQFLKWALQPPGWRQDWHCGVRVVKSGRLVGFISGIPAHLVVYKKERKMVEINFLCVHKKLRSKRLAPVLIREITRRVNLTGIFQAVYTAGVVLPKPVSVCRYWHRSLNPKKLIEVYIFL